jgi:hypothetical protein|tara:strand:- start:629 stop:862 length:234 start_codon:yes stop_codon:yes gene_type:complete
MEDRDTKEVYDNICVVTREDINKDVEGEVLNFRPNEFLKVVIGKSVALNLQYEPSQGVYIGEKSKMPFFSKGPKKLK